jgi:uncharacterized protein (TIGR03435 family)
MGGSTSLSQMAMTLSQYTGRMVFDRTGLEGNFDYDIEFGPDPSMRGRGPGGGLPGSPSDGAPRPAVSDRPSLFTAVQVQLGLRLDSQRGAVDVLVVDSADQPSEN